MRRLLWLDLARGLAVVSMVFAHFYPAQGGQFDLSEYLTAPLFAFVMGAGVWLSWQARPQVGPFLATALMRGSLLIGLGLLLQPLTVVIDVVLEELGALQVALALLWIASRRSRAVLVGALITISVVAPLVLSQLRMGRSPTRPRGSTAGHWSDWLTALLASGQHYRLTTFAVFGISGLLVSSWLAESARSPRRRTVLACSLLAGLGALAAMATARETPWGWHPYSGSWLEELGASLLCTAVVTGLAWLSPLLSADSTTSGPLANPLRSGTWAAWCEPLRWLGRASLTAYTVQVLVSSALIRWTEWPSPSHALLWTTLLVCLAAVAPFVVSRREAPLEWLIRQPERWLITARRG